MKRNITKFRSFRIKDISGWELGFSETVNPTKLTLDKQCYKKDPDTTTLRISHVLKLILKNGECIRVYIPTGENEEESYTSLHDELRNIFKNSMFNDSWLEIKQMDVNEIAIYSIVNDRCYIVYAIRTVIRELLERTIEQIVKPESYTMRDNGEVFEIEFQKEIVIIPKIISQDEATEILARYRIKYGFNATREN